MLLKKVKNRLSILVALLLISTSAIFLILKVLDDNVLYFYSPSDIKNSNDISLKKKIRIGGMVKNGSIQSNESEIKFVVTDLNNEIIVSYSGTVPALFAEGKGVVAEGKLKDKKFFIAKRILAKHDENYMPPELKESLNKDAKQFRNYICNYYIIIKFFINSEEITFTITDYKNEVKVVYSGLVPNLFVEGKGVVAEGFLKDRNFFSAIKILAKHDENYMPPEVKEALGEK